MAEAGVHARLVCASRRCRGPRSRRRRRRSSTGPAGRGTRPGASRAGRPSWKKVYSCSMPNHGSWSAYFSATSTQAARVLVGCGVMSGSSTSHMTSLSSPPRMGSGHWRPGAARSPSSHPAPGWCSNRRSPRWGAPPSAMILVFDRRRRRLGAVDPDVLSPVAHASSSLRNGMVSDGGPVGQRTVSGRRPGPAVAHCMNAM
jgi:hypothetical protein